MVFRCKPLKYVFCCYQQQSRIWAISLGQVRDNSSFKLQTRKSNKATLIATDHKSFFFLDDNNHTLATLKLCHDGGKCAGIIRPEGWSGERNTRNYIAADIQFCLRSWTFFYSLSILQILSCGEGSNLAFFLH